ncbi:hypothetical protein BC827DRAFT_1141698 [Russula dissimulans]|nr:hypothetical protein BC827DRAFT_1141698 [Russula dissimulans]
MFGPEDVGSYLPRILRVETQPLRLNVSHEWPQVFFITSPVVQNARPCLSINGQPAWLLDYAIQPVGTVVPQMIWSPRLFSGSQRSANLLLRMPIFFAQTDRVNIGLPLVQAVAGDCKTLLNAGAAAPVGDCSTTYIRINWPGYPEWTTQIMIKDQTSEHNTISLEKFARRLASVVSRFMNEAQKTHCREPNWLVGIGGITVEQVILIGAIHVSQGSWQPILQLNRYVVPRRQHLPGLL